MRYTKRYFWFALIIIATLMLKLNTWSDDYAKISSFRGAELKGDVFYPLIARSLNEEGLLTLEIDGEARVNLDSNLYMDGEMIPCMSLNFIQSIFGASANACEGVITVERNGERYKFVVGEDEAEKNNSSFKLSKAPVNSGNEYYLPIEDLCKLFNYEYAWDEATYSVSLSSPDGDESYLPKVYDLRKYNRVSEVRDQGTEATCWAFASIEALESSIRPEQQMLFDPQHMIKNNTYGRNANDGGDYMIAVSYLLSWNGPVEEGTSEVCKHLQSVRFFDETDLDAIKWAIYQCGAVSTSIYVDVSSGSMDDSSYYNDAKGSYCYMGNKEPNHDVIIIGWDDNYSSANFNNQVDEDGAFICMNSWGDDFGDDGVFYVSYEDSNIGSQGVAYETLSSINNYDSIYQTDLCGQIGTIGYSKSEIYGANVYKAECDEILRAVGFYSTSEDTDYTVYAVDNYTGEKSLLNRVEVASGTVDTKGYFTIPLEKRIELKKGDSFAVVVRLETPNTDHPMAVEYESEKRTKKITIEDGVGFVSRNGVDWESSEEKYNANVCLKAYTNNR